MRRNNLTIAMVALLSILMTACGGGGGGGDSDHNNESQTPATDNNEQGGGEESDGSDEGGQTGDGQDQDGTGDDQAGSDDGSDVTPPPPPPRPENNYSTRHTDQIKASEPLLEGVNGSGVTIAMIDSGISYGHDEFAGKYVSYFDALEDNGDRIYTGTAATDEHGHGSLTASLAAGANIGVAPMADLAIYKVFTSDRIDNGSSSPHNIRSSDLVQAMQRAAADGTASVISFSVELNMAPALNNQPQRDAILAGIGESDWVVVDAAGNGGGTSGLDAGYADDPEFQGHFIAVGGVDSNNVIAEFSNRAYANVDLQGSFGDKAGVIEHFIVAPATGICGASNSLDSPTQRVTGCNGRLAENSSPASSYTRDSGVSFAAPLVAGAAALIRSEYPQFKGNEVVDILLDSATDLGVPGVDPIYGAGLLNVDAALELADERAKAIVDPDEPDPEEPDPDATT